MRRGASPAPEEHAVGLPPRAEGDTAIGRMAAVVGDVLRYGVFLSFAVIQPGVVRLFVSRETGYAGLTTPGRASGCRP